MTLAIAVKYPYGKLAGALQSLAQIRNIRYPQAIIFVSDSRWSYDNPIMFEDIGAKLFAINRNTIISYSGDVRAAKLCIEEFKKRVENKNVRSFNASALFQYLYKNLKQSEPSTKRLLLLIGSFSPKGGTKLVYSESPDFRYTNITGIKGIGNKDAIEAVIKEVEPVINDISIYEGKEKDYITLAKHFTNAMLKLAIRNASYNDIGGPVQCIILDSNGPRAPSLKYTSDPTGKTDKWHNATATSDEMIAIGRRWNLAAKYLNKSRFGLYSYCD
jgi:20S proteasome alpha/beta subunit